MCISVRVGGANQRTINNVRHAEESNYRTYAFLVLDAAHTSPENNEAIWS
jgi:transcriptional regulator of met regulon